MIRFTLLLLVGVQVTFANLAHAQTSAKPLEFRPGNAKQAALLAKYPDARELVADRFSLAIVDLDGDGKSELVLRADTNANCGSGGCLTLVIQERGNRMTTLLSQNLFPNLGVTDEKVGPYRALAALDDKGGIAVGDRPGTPMYGKPMVYPMLAQAATEPTATPTSAAPAQAKRRRPDIFGIQVGGSGINEARAALVALNANLGIKEYFTELVGSATRNRGMSQSVAIEGSRFLSRLEAGTNGFQHRCQNFSQSTAKADCETVWVHFSGPPDAGTAVAMFRESYFRGGASVDTVMKGLTTKYGPPSLIKDYQGRGFSFDITWAWTDEGTLMQLKDGHPCARGNAAVLRADANAQYEFAGAMLGSRCAVILQVKLGAPNSIVGSMSMTLADHATIRATTSKTIDFVVNHVGKIEQRERDAAAKATAPKL